MSTRRGSLSFFFFPGLTQGHCALWLEKCCLRTWTKRCCVPSSTFQEQKGKKMEEPHALPQLSRKEDAHLELVKRVAAGTGQLAGAPTTDQGSVLFISFPGQHPNPNPRAGFTQSPFLPQGETIAMMDARKGSLLGPPTKETRNPSSPHGPATLSAFSVQSLAAVHPDIEAGGGKKKISSGSLHGPTITG